MEIFFKLLQRSKSYFVLFMYPPAVLVYFEFPSMKFFFVAINLDKGKNLFKINMSFIVFILALSSTKAHQ